MVARLVIVDVKIAWAKSGARKPKGARNASGDNLRAQNICRHGTFSLVLCARLTHPSGVGLISNVRIPAAIRGRHASALNRGSSLGCLRIWATQSGSFTASSSETEERDRGLRCSHRRTFRIDYCPMDRRVQVGPCLLRQQYHGRHLALSTSP